MKTKTSFTTNSMNRSPRRQGLFLIPLISLACFALSPQVQAICQKGCLTNSNTVFGDDALINNTTGSGNTGTGWQALYSNTIGLSNTANGFAALHENTSGNVNTANGNSALYYNTTGSANTATGFQALEGNATGGNNTATGYHALFSNVTGNSNTANGDEALYFNTSGSNNIAVGANAGLFIITGSNNIDVGNEGVIGDANTIRIGTAQIQTATFIAGIRNTPLAHGAAVAVGITADGQLGVRASSARFKELVKPMDKASEAILALKPVTFHYKREFDPDGIPQFGLVAEEVEKVNPDLVARDQDGRPYTVRYEAVNAMLLNEFLKEHRKVEALQASFAQQQKESRSTVAQQQNEIKALAATVKEQAAQIQKVSAQVQASKPAPQVVNNP